jgi:hypothetical protein
MDPGRGCDVRGLWIRSLSVLPPDPSSKVVDYPRAMWPNAPYRHAGQFTSLREVLEHCNRAPVAPSRHTELQPLNPSEQELA